HPNTFLNDFASDAFRPNFNDAGVRLTEMKEALAKQSRYALGHSEQELERLSRQAEIFEPFTRQLLQQAGISRGMRVLDVGCGSGDVSFLASELVGPSGKVTVPTRPYQRCSGQQSAHARSRLGTCNSSKAIRQKCNLIGHLTRSSVGSS